jgi:integrase
MKIINYKAKDKSTELAIDIFSFSYYCGGINFKDISYLTKENIMGNRLIYCRRKTKQLVKIPIKEAAMEIIKKYETSNIYLFPILTECHKTEVQRENRLHKIISMINIKLKQVGRELNLPMKITTYVARHSFATALKRSGINIALISETLGHSDIKTTQIYLDAFENEEIDKAMDNLL